MYFFIAYLLYDSGYDVWLGNARGNTYSRAHTHWSIDDAKFWNFRYDIFNIKCKFNSFLFCFDLFFYLYLQFSRNGST